MVQALAPACSSDKSGRDKLNQSVYNDATVDAPSANTHQVSICTVFAHTHHRTEGTCNHCSCRFVQMQSARYTHAGCCDVAGSYASVMA